MKVETSLTTAAAKAAEQAQQAHQTHQAQRIDNEARGAEFSERVRDAVGGLVETGNAADRSVAELMTGGETDMHAAMVQMGRADLELRFMVQVRNRAIAAYEEMMRLQM